MASPGPSPLAPSTGCCVVGGGPGGMFLALLLARQGVEVTLLESHHDFDRDFRGDTVHPSTLELLDKLGLARELHEMPHTRLHEMLMTAPEGVFSVAKFSRLPSRFPYIMLLPQAKLLQFLADHARQYPNFHLVMGAQVNDLVREGKDVVGVRYQKEGAKHELRAVLTVAADGRFSKLRKLAGLEPVRTSPPMDVVWFRVPRHPSDKHDMSFFVNNGRLAVLLEREDAWQVGYVIPKGGYQQLRAAGIEAFRQEVARLVPWLADRAGGLDWPDLTLLSVESSRLKRWYLPGLLLIGDAAHVMSPVGGVGISYAVQDAVAASNLLAEPLRRGKVTVADLAAVQARREWPVRVIQRFQGFMQRQLVAPALDRGKPFQRPLPLRLITTLPLLRDLPARLVGYGVRREWPRGRNG